MEGASVIHPIQLRAERMSLANGRFLQDKAFQPLCQRLAGPGRLHSMASGSFRDAKLERPVSGAELRRLLVASRPDDDVEL